MFFKSCYVDAFTVIIFYFIICIKILITHLFQKLIYEIQNNLHQLATHMSTLIMWHNSLVKTKTRSWRHIYHDIEIPRPKSHDIEIPRPKNHDIEKRRQISHDIVIPRRFFRGQKATTSRFQDFKTTTSRFQGQKATTSSSRNSDPYAPDRIPTEYQRNTSGTPPEQRNHIKRVQANQLSSILLLKPSKYL